jgi:hypothetical protein
MALYTLPKRSALCARSIQQASACLAAGRIDEETGLPADPAIPLTLAF